MGNGRRLLGNPCYAQNPLINFNIQKKINKCHRYHCPAQQNQNLFSPRLSSPSHQFRVAMRATCKREFYLVIQIVRYPLFSSILRYRSRSLRSFRRHAMERMRMASTPALISTLETGQMSGRGGSRWVMGRRRDSTYRPCRREL